MIQYLVILLDDTSVSFCHYANTRDERKPMPLDVLKGGILYGMKENLNIQFVYPDYELPEAYKQVIDTINHTSIKPATLSGDADVVVINGLGEAKNLTPQPDVAYVIRIGKAELFESTGAAIRLIEKADRINVVLTDIETFSEQDFAQYNDVLAALSATVEHEYVKGRSPQLNILTDRMMLDSMNNCGAGDTNITLAPDGKFYVCPAFYQSGDSYSIGGLAEGQDIKNAQLYKLDHAPLCRHCDAYQCRRCIWLNRKTTLEVNTPSHEQCVIAHIERNASRNILFEIRKHGIFMPDKEEIREIDYLDPFDVRKEW